MRRRLLVVDDNQTTVDALRVLLEMDGYQVAAFSRPTEALAALREGLTDLVITDLEMPAVHGTEVVRAARLSGTPVLVVTAYASSPAVTDALALGAARVMLKPIDYDELLAAVAAALADG